MSKRFAKALLTVGVLTVMGFSTVWAQTPAPQKQWLSQQEYNDYTEFTKTADPAKRLALLNAWKQKYPNSAFKEDALPIFLVTYTQLNQPAKAVETAKEILTANPKDSRALLVLTQLTRSQPPTPDSLATGEKAAQGLLEAPKLPEVPDEAAWKKARAAEAYTTLAFVATQRKQPETAEQQYAKWLTEDPGNAFASYSLGNTILGEKKPERYPEMLYHWARAASLTGPGALPDALLKQVSASLQKAYTTFHGQDDAGLTELRALAITQPMPPAGFKIKAKHEVEQENAEKFAKENPQLALWKTIKDGLLAENGAQYWESLKGTAPPKMKGKLVSHKPALRPKEIVLSMDEDKPQVTLKLENPLPGKAEPATELQFQGVPEEFTKEPFMLTFTVDSKDKIEGWPAQAAPPAKKGPASKKSTATRKKL